MVSRAIAVGGLCAVLGLSACGHQASSETAGASAVTGSSASVVPTTVMGTGTVTSLNRRTITTRTRGGTRGVQTAPQIAPAQGGPRSLFLVRLTSRTRLGAHGILTAVYRVIATGPPKPVCDRGATSTIDHGAAGRRLTVVLRPGPGGWCRGDWRGLVFLQTGPSCRSGRTASGPRCPAFASRLIKVGRFRWRVS